MRVEIVKRADGAGVLRCTRADGSITWQKQKHGAYFALHDLTHFAVESTLGLRRGFLGLIAEGWGIDDTTGKGTRGPLPPEAGWAEQLAGLFFLAQTQNWTAEDVISQSAGPLSREQVDAVRRRQAELYAEWAGVPVGGVLQLEFPV